MGLVKLQRNILNPEVNWSQGLYANYSQVLFDATAHKQQLFVHQRASYIGRFNAPDFSSLGECQLAQHKDLGYSEIIFDSKASVLILYHYDKNSGIQFAFAAESLDEINQKIAEVEKLLERISEYDSDIPFTFWYFSQANRAPLTRIRSIAVPTWKDIVTNYSTKTFQHLNQLMSSRPKIEDGKLMLWNGEAGTGKTFAIRSLAHAWKDWCSFEYAIDPEALFNSSDYVVEAVLHAADELPKKQPRWRCLVLEDCGEMIAMDSKNKIGQALSRLLNLADGLLGQGLEVIFLITTNDELEKLHPAVSRLGRCFSKIEFQKLSMKESDDWLQAHQSSIRVSGPKTLSDLYGML